MRRVDRLLFTCGAVLISVYFLVLARYSLRAWFSFDDLMNLYRAWTPPPSLLFKGNLLFFRVFPFYRPLGSSWYRLIFHFAGFNPLPFHLAYLTLFLLNLLLTYALARRLAGLRETGAVAALLTSYHHRFANLFLDTGYIYDALCYTFYFSAFLLYLRARQQKRLPTASELAACSLLFICSLNSKEMAVTLPAVLLIYELVFHPPVSVTRWMLYEGRGTLVMGIIALVFVIGIFNDPHSLALIDPSYRPVFTPARFMETSRHFLGDIFSYENDWPAWGVLSLWGALLLIAWLTKSKALRFAWLFLMITPLPVAFLLHRGAAQYYIPWFGWVFYASVLLIELVKRLMPRLPAPIRGSAVVLGLALLLFPFFERRGWPNATVTASGPVVRSAAQQLHSLYPHFRPGARLYFMEDPFGADRGYDLMFLVRLSYQDNGLIVDRAKVSKLQPDEKLLASYDHVFDYRAGRFYELHRPWIRNSQPEIVQTADGPEFYHEGFLPVTSSSPAVSGELVTAKAIDLGPTDPPVAQGQPFPPARLLPVAARVEVEVDGLKAEVINKIGWPEMVNTYRIDFRVPRGMTHREVPVVIRVNNRQGPPVMLPVRVWP